jgi:hypothetical protein
MEALYRQIQEYLNMNEEIPYDEFSTFYQKVIDKLNEGNEQLDEDGVWKSLFLVENIMSNSDARAKDSKGAQVKKYKKMSQRSQLWAKNLVGRLYKLGYDDDQINERFEGMLAENEEKTEA